jgi:transmembrane sensor
VVDSHGDIERQAAEWLARRDGGNWTAADRAALDEWLDASTARAVAYIRLETAWSRADRCKALGAGFAPGHIPTPAEVGRSPFFEEARALANTTAAGAMRRPWWRQPFSWAASVALVCAGALLWHMQTSASSYRTPVGGTASVPMSDGSRVTLNTDSEVRLSVSEILRRVELRHGEAFFEVAADPHRPFVVEAGSRRITVLGTKFSVLREGNDVRVAVTEGKVRLEGASPAPAADATSGAAILEAGAVARTGPAGVLVQSKRVSEIQDALSWRTGFLVFRDVDLAGAVAEFNRYNEKKVVIADPALASIRLSGKFKADNFLAFVRLLEDGFPIEARQGAGGVVLEKRVD